ncbi:MAG: hypothetical protein ACTHJ5_17015 [Ilyomonas sp.]
MPRYNGFYLIHKALRAMLYDTALCIQQTYFANTDEAEIALEKTETVLHAFEQHAHHEDEFINPALQVYEPALAEQFENEHVEDHLLSNRLKNLINIYRNLNFSAERIEAGSAISKTWVEFMVFNLKHMAKEESVLNQALWKHYTDEEIIALNERLVKSIPPHEMNMSAIWMIRSGNDNDLVTWLKGIKSSAPEFIFQSLLTTIKNELPAYRSTNIVNAVTEEAAVIA